jgi:hypothetical protein
MVLVKRGADKPLCYACAKCGSVYSLQNAQCAELCCALKVCGGDGCEVEPPKHRIYCKECSAKLDAAKEAKQFEAAEKVPYSEWKGGHLYSDRLDKYFPGWGEYLEELENECDLECDMDPEPYLWDCICMKLTMSADDVIEGALGDHHEDAWDWISDEKELQELLDKWCAKQNVETFYPSSNRAVMAPVENTE